MAQPTMKLLLFITALITISNGRSYPRPYDYGRSVPGPYDYYEEYYTTERPSPTVLTRTDPRCSLPKEAGRCQDYTLNWYYNSQNQACTYFWYGGCDGNANRFKTQEECGNACPLTRTVSTGPDPRCNLPKDAGPCTDHTRQTYYDKQTNACVSFWYGGCRGNANRFETQDECSKTCIA